MSLVFNLIRTHGTQFGTYGFLMDESGKFSCRTLERVDPNHAKYPPVTAFQKSRFALKEGPYRCVRQLSTDLKLGVKISARGAYRDAELEALRPTSPGSVGVGTLTEGFKMEGGKERMQLLHQFLESKMADGTLPLKFKLGEILLNISYSDDYEYSEVEGKDTKEDGGVDWDSVDG